MPWRGAVASACAVAALMALAAQHGPGAPPTLASVAAEPEPVVLVHGWHGSPAQMETMRDALQRAGHPTYVATLPGERNVPNAQAIGALVERASAEHGGARVGLVGHSMGGLSTRWYLGRLGGAERVTDYVSMGTSQRGFGAACLLAPDDGGEMCPTSDLITELNAGDQTPGAVRYTTLHSSQDASKDERPLDGVACTAVIDGVAHQDEPGSPEFIAAVRTALDGGCPR